MSLDSLLRAGLKDAVSTLGSCATLSCGGVVYFSGSAVWVSSGAGWEVEPGGAYARCVGKLMVPAEALSRVPREGDHATVEGQRGKFLVVEVVKSPFDPAFNLSLVALK